MTHVVASVTYLHHVDDVIRQPKKTESQHDGQDEFLTTNASPKLGLTDPTQDADVADHDDSVGNQKP